MPHKHSKKEMLLCRLLDLGLFSENDIVWTAHVRGARVLGVDNAPDHLLHLVALPPQAEGEGALDHDIQHDAQAPHVCRIALVLGLCQHLHEAKISVSNLVLSFKL